MRNSNSKRFFWLVVVFLMTITVSSAVYPRITYASVPSWDGASCEEEFLGEFDSIWAAKVYPGPPAYILMSGKVGAYDIYRSDWTGMAWGPPYPVATLSTASKDSDVAVIGNQVYIVSANSIVVCPWDEMTGTAGICLPQDGTAGAGIISNINPRDNFMYYSGGESGEVRRFDMSVETWESDLIGDPDNGIYVVNWQSFGVYVGQDFAIISAECDGGFPSPYDCDDAEISRFHMYTFPGWTVQSAPLSNVYDLHPDTKVASPYVAPDGSFWFVGTPTGSPEQRHLYSCQPDPADGYCLGSADSHNDCCPALPAVCVGQGCAGYDCGVCIPSPDCTDKECGEVPDGCGAIHSCGICSGSDTCTEGHCIPECVPTTCLELDYECGSVDNGCGSLLNCGTCADGYACNASGECICIPNCAGKVCGDDGCEGTCGTCADGYACNDSGECICAPDCAGKVCGDDGCEGTCGTCADGYACNDSGECICVPNCAGKVCGDDGCEGTCGTCTLPETCNASGQCESGCTNNHPNLSGLDSGCEPLNYCGSNPAIDPITIRNKSGETCHFSMDVKHDGTPVAQITMVDICTGAGCIQSTFECEGPKCAIAYGDVTVIDNGQGITAKPSGEDVTTGIVGTNYQVRRYLESGDDIFEAICSLGHVWYTFHFPEGDFTVNLGTCDDCQEEVMVNLTEDIVIDPDPPDGEPDGGDVDAGGDCDHDAEVIEGPDASDGDCGPDTDADNPDGGTDTTDSDIDYEPGSNGGCQCSTSNHSSGIPAALFLALFGILLLRRRQRVPVKTREIE